MNYKEATKSYTVGVVVGAILFNLLLVAMLAFVARLFLQDMFPELVIDTGWSGFFGLMFFISIMKGHT